MPARFICEDRGRCYDGGQLAADKGGAFPFAIILVSSTVDRMILLCMWETDKRRCSILGWLSLGLETTRFEDRRKRQAQYGDDIESLKLA